MGHLPNAPAAEMIVSSYPDITLQDEISPEGATLFRHSLGAFVKGEGNEWWERNDTGENTFAFDQIGEDRNYYYLQKRHSDMQLRVPKQEGWLQFSYEGESLWRNLYFTSPY